MDIQVSTARGMITVPALVRPDAPTFALHIALDSDPATGNPRWTITHVPTGLTIGHYFTNSDTAIAAFDGICKYHDLLVRLLATGQRDIANVGIRSIVAQAQWDSILKAFGVDTASQR